MMRRTWIARLLTAAVAAAALVGPSYAGIIPASVSITPEAGNFRWTYAVVLPTDMKLQSGDFFTVYDFGGFVPGTIVTPDGWTATTANTTAAPSGLKPTDNADITNLTFTYSGAPQTGQTGLGNFWAVSTIGSSVKTDFTAQNPQASTGLLDRNIVDTIAPAPPGPVTPPSGVPEPTTMALAGLGLPFVGLARLFRRKK